MVQIVDLPPPGTRTVVDAAGNDVAPSPRKVPRRPPVDEVPGDAAPPVSDRPDASGGMNEIVASVGRGVVKGATETLGNALKYAKGLVRGDFGQWDDPDFQREVASSEETHGIAEGIGKFGERVAEFVAGDAAANAGMKALGLTAKTLPLAIRAGAGMIKGAAVGGGITAAQGGNPTVGAALGAGGEALGAAAEAAGPALKTYARSKYTQFLSPTGKGNKLKALDVVDEALDRGVQGSLRKVSETAGEGKNAANEALQDAYAQHGSTRVNVDDIQQSLDEAKQQFVVSPASNSTKLVPMSQSDAGAVKTIDGLKQVIDDASDAGQIDIDRLRKIRGAWYKVANANQVGPLGAVKTLEQEVHANAADSLKDIINSEMPPEAMIEKINHEYTFWKRFEKVANDTIVRKTGQATPMGEQLVGAGAVAGRLASGDVVGALVDRKLAQLMLKAARSGPIQSRAAVLANALAKGQKLKAAGILNGIIKAGASTATSNDNDDQQE